MKSAALLSFIFLFLLGSSAFGIGLGVNPARLEFNINSEEDLDAEIEVINNNDERYSFNAYSDSNAVEVFPGEFSLTGGKNRKVLVRLDAGEFDDDFNATVFIVAEAGGEGSRIRAGVKVPATVKLINREFLREKIGERAAEGKGEENFGREGEGGGNALTGLVPFVTSQPFMGAMVLVVLVLMLLVARKRRHER